jgi:micrococcal nuclease
VKRLLLLPLLILLLAGCQAVLAPRTSPSPASVTTTPPVATIALTAQTTPTTKQEASVVGVVDGDTIKVQINGQVERVRYIGMDTPETVHPSRPVEWMGKEASAKNEELVSGKAVLLEKDVSETDQYGRLLRYVYVGDMMVNAELVRLGYAQVSTFPPDVRYQDLFLRLQREAREAGLGLWGPQPTPVAEIRQSPVPSATATAVVACANAIAWPEAKSYVGQQVTVQGPLAGAKYARTSRGKPTFLDIGNPYPSPDRFTVLIWGDARDAFPSPPEQMYAGKTVCVTGMVEDYEGGPEIIVSSPASIVVLP